LNVHIEKSEIGERDRFTKSHAIAMPTRLNASPLDRSTSEFAQASCLVEITGFERLRLEEVTCEELDARLRSFTSFVFFYGISLARTEVRIHSQRMTFDAQRVGHVAGTPVPNGVLVSAGDLDPENAATK